MITTGPLRLTRGAAHASTRVMTALCALLSALFLLAFLNGCSLTPARQSYVAVGAATDAVNGISDAYEAHLLTKADLVVISPYADAVKVAQDDLDNAILAHKTDLNSLRQALTDAFLNLANAKSAQKRGLALPPIPPHCITTLPTT